MSKDSINFLAGSNPSESASGDFNDIIASSETINMAGGDFGSILARGDSSNRLASADTTTTRSST